MRRYVSLKSAAAVLTILLCSHFFCPAGQAALKGGCAKVNITPPLGIPLIGSYGKPSDDILDELYAKALVLSDGNNSIAIISADLLYTPLEEITNPARRIIKERTGIPEEHILICATHTHSGPEVFTRSKLGPDQEIPPSKIDQCYLQTLIRKIADAAVLAHKHTRGVKIGAAKGRIPEIAFNRRPKAADGSAVMTLQVSAEVAATREIEMRPDGSTAVSFTLDVNEPNLTFGPIDPDVWVLRVEDANNIIVGSIVNFACHPVCVYPYLPTAISADYPGDATDMVEQTEGGVCLFALGTAGDIVPYQRGVKAHQQIGRALGAEALRRLQPAGTWAGQFVGAADDATLDAVKKEIKFPVKKSVSADDEKKPDKVAEYITTEMQILRLGDIYILGLPGEVLAEVGLEIKKRAGIEKLFVVSLSNDAIGYVCHGRAYEEGGYEPGEATNLAKGAGETMTEEALDLIKQIQQRR